MIEKMEIKTQEKSGLTRRKSAQYVKFCPKEERNASLKKVSTILQKAENERTLEEQQILSEYSEIVTDLKLRWHRRDEAKRRLEEVEEPLDILDEKCKILATALAQSEHLVIYTGAGISTAARIPDYRGTNGIWTRLQQGKEIGNHDLSLAEPTFTHMALSQLYHQKKLKYIVSQNCDGLHLRSGLPRCALSELHGNMYVEVCKNCKPVREYWRLFDVTENTARFSHKTMRRCYVCSNELVDTIVHFGERGTLQWPLNWSGACKNADAADTILCLGSSLKVLKRYPWLWQMNKPAKKRPNLYIVNLQWTPKDDCAVMKIHGKCDEVMKRIMKILAIDVPKYNRENDPIFAHATLLNDLEMHTTNQPSLKLEMKTEFDIKIDEKSEVMIKEEENMKHIDNSINLLEAEQNEAYDLSLNKHLTNNVKVSQEKNCTPSLFSIESILNKTEKRDSDISKQNENATIMAYYEFANSLLQNQMFGYLTSGFYPFQTSFMYSGLHSIINPIPYFNCDFNPIENSMIKSEKIAQPACEFCHKLFKSLVCFYYSSEQPLFKKQLFRFSKLKNCNKKLVCVCCDYTTEEESDSDNNDDKNDVKSKKKLKRNCENEKLDDCASENVDEINICEENAKKSEKTIKIQAGWFGKGYRKNRKSRKK